MIDFYRPDGTLAPVVRGDPRQLNDATFHAGTSSDSEYEYVDNFNRLHFYVLNTFRDEDGVLFYDVGVRRFGGAGPFQRDVALGNPAKTPSGRGSSPRAPSRSRTPVRPARASSTPTSTACRPPRAATTGRPGFPTRWPSRRPARPSRWPSMRWVPEDDEPDARTTITLTATSETDSSQTATSTCNVHVRDTSPN